MGKCKYKIGDVVNGRTIIKIAHSLYYTECPDCGRVAGNSLARFEKGVCVCKRLYDRRYSGFSYINSEKKIQAIKEKYKYGITNEILNEFMNISL